MWKNTSSAIFVSNIFSSRTCNFIWFSLFSSPRQFSQRDSRDECASEKFFDSFFHLSKSIKRKQFFCAHARSLIALSSFIPLPSSKPFHVPRTREKNSLKARIRKKLLNWFFTQYRFAFILLEMRNFFPRRTQIAWALLCNIYDYLAVLHEKWKQISFHNFFSSQSTRVQRAIIECDGDGIATASSANLTNSRTNQRSWAFNLISIQPVCQLSAS